MTFTVNGNDWVVRFVNIHSNNLRRSDGSFALGICDDNLKTIFIADNQDEYKTEHILCHEITHSICFEYVILWQTMAKKLYIYLMIYCIL